MIRTRLRRRGDRGAAAVEFALVMPLLLAVLSGILDYGFYFNNSISVRQGVREAARQGVVQTAAAGSCASQVGYMAQLACTADLAIGPVNGAAYSKVFYTSWATGQTLTVCSMVSTKAVIGLVPYPKDGWTTSRTDMSIEVTSTTPSGDTSFAQQLPEGASWSWCS